MSNFMPRTADHDRRRHEIAEAIWQVIATRGLEAVTMRSVAAAANISVGRIQHYFSTKEEMVRYSCRAMIGVAADAFEQSLSTDRPLAALRQLVTHAIPRSEASRIGTTVWYAYVTKSVNDPEIAAILREAKRGEQEEGVRLVRAAQQAGQIDQGLDATVVVGRLLATADGLALRVLIGQLSTPEAVGSLEQDLSKLR